MIYDIILHKVHKQDFLVLITLRIIFRVISLVCYIKMFALIMNKS